MAGKRHNNKTGLLWTEPSETKNLPLITVAPVAPIERTYTFTASEDLAGRIRPGQRVLVPFGPSSRLATAFVVAIDRGPWTSSLKSVESILDPAGELSPHLIDLARWIAGHYCCPLGRTLAALVPEAVRRQSGFKTVRYAALNKPLGQLTSGRVGPKQRTLLEKMASAGKPVEVRSLLESAGATRATLRNLIAKGWVTETVRKEVPRETDDGQPPEEPGFSLNADQEKALGRVDAAIAGGVFRALVLFGVSGSGKTEVYVQAIRRVLAAGKQAVMLVPEIALTTQLVQRLARRFERVAVVHSGLTGVQRSLAFEAIRRGEKQVVIGTRSAVFAPCPDLGLIVVDEEQEPSYKNLQSPRFGVRDVAIKRAHMLGIPIVLGSATPSLETWQNMLVRPSYERIDLPRRVRDLTMPKVRLVDMRDSIPGGDRGQGISKPLADELCRTLEKRQQAILLLNRRGFATWLFCPKCKRRIECPNCRAGMVLHRARQQVVCHHCYRHEPIPSQCPDMSCRGGLVLGGSGTERIEDELNRRFPDARITRADSDTMTHVSKYRRLVTDFEAGEIDVLVGTQMIAKGLDFPGVSLVGVIGADVTSQMADFRVNERLFQLVTQVAGRAGRADVPGTVIVQTMSPELGALRCACKHDYESFVSTELHSRRALGFPPFARLTRFVVTGKRDAHTGEQAEALADRLRTAVGKCGEIDADVFGPSPCIIERMRGKYRHEVLLRAATPTHMREVLDAARRVEAFKTPGATLMVDVDPVSLT